MKGRILKSQLQEELNTIFDIACQVKKYPLHLSMREYTKEHNNSVSPCVSKVEMSPLTA
jgi:hypothetical protein